MRYSVPLYPSSEYWVLDGTAAWTPLTSDAVPVCVVVKLCVSVLSLPLFTGLLVPFSVYVTPFDVTVCAADGFCSPSFHVYDLVVVISANAVVGIAIAPMPSSPASVAAMATRPMPVCVSLL